MRITIRLIVSLVLVVGLVAVVFSYHQVKTEKALLTEELERRAVMLSGGLHDSIIQPFLNQDAKKLGRIMGRVEKSGRLAGAAVYDIYGSAMVSISKEGAAIEGPNKHLTVSMAEKRPSSGIVRAGGKTYHVYVSPIMHEDNTIGFLELVQDAKYMDDRLSRIWKNNLLRFVTLSALIVAITLIVVRWSVTGPIALFAEWVRDLRKGKTRQPISYPKGDVLTPLMSEVAQLAKVLATARAAAEHEAKLRLHADSLWTAARLKEHMRLELGGKKLFLVSNREPYMHIKEGHAVKCIVPAGGLVTALDPVMRACDGVWIANGSGNADRETVEQGDSLRVPPEEPSYSLRRVWLSKEEEEGYYYGYSNEGIWPLCHITYVRPVFRLDDWVHYQKVNQKFADAVVEEISGEQSPLVLIQDYHLALLPLLIKEKRPDAKVAIFWHIPWPNPEAYGICPWRQEMLIGMLGADLIGFHIQFHCNNFLESVDRFLESKIDWERFSVERGGHATYVKPFPISVPMETAEDTVKDAGMRAKLKESLLKDLGIKADYLGMGVDRIDYTKGIPERFRAVKRFLEKYPEFTGRFTFVELGAPSRTYIKRYHDLMAEVEEMADRINWQFQSKGWKPIVFMKGHHGHAEIKSYYRAADVCMVTSLHDGMNLVAKEFVSNSEDNDGVLILSQFAGASRELRDALVINPYDTEEMADAIHTALVMDPVERAERMKRMRIIVREYNIYRWAGDLMTTLARLRLDDIQERG